MRLTALTLLAVLAFAVGVWAQNTTSSGSSVTIATVNSEPITRADLDRVRRGHADASLGSLLLDLVDERVLVQRGRNLGYAVGEQQLKTIVENV